MDLTPFVRCGTLAHGHSCPPLVLGLRASAAAMGRLGVGRALDRELFAFVELGSDHYAQGFADGVQVATGCTFGKDLIVRIPHGKAILRLVDQLTGRAVRVGPRPATIARIEGSDWFRACSMTGRFSDCARAPDPLVGELLAIPEDELLVVSPVFPLQIEHPAPSFESLRCEACGESVLSPYARTVEGRRLCPSCEDWHRARTR
jgi:formylmethanofuran dehydrogenase subunit E